MNYKNVLVFAFSLFYISTLCAQQHLRIISYNILEGMTKDQTIGKINFVNWLKAYEPDVLALQEANSFTDKTLTELAHSYGHPYAVLLKDTGFPVALTSKTPITNVKKVIEGMHHGFILAETAGFNLAIIHFSPFRYDKRKEEVNCLLKNIKQFRRNGNKWIIMGDFNAHSPLDKEFYEDGRLVKRMQEIANKYSHHQNLIEGKYLDFSVHQKILDAGYIDTYKLKRPTEKRYSRIDFLYVDEKLKDKTINAVFIKDEFTKKHSDHLPLLVDIKTN